MTLSSNGLLFYHPSINVSVPVPLRSPRGGRAQCHPRCPLQDYIHSTHGKEMDLLRTTVKVPGKRPPRAISACGPSASINGLLRDPEPGGEPPGGHRGWGGHRGDRSDTVSSPLQPASPRWG